MITRATVSPQKRSFYLPAVLVIYLIIFLSLGGQFDVEAQSEDVIVLSVAPLFPMPDVFTDDLFAPFEAEHPNVQVAVAENPFIISYPNNDIQNYLNRMVEYARSADVISVGSTFTPMATRAGIVLALDPLITADPTFDPAASYHPEVWNTFQWDMHTWALPAATTITVLAYNPTAFDAQEISYPQANWTLDDYGNAARTLTQYDEDDNIRVPGLAYRIASPARIVVSLANVPLIGEDDLPNFDQPELESVIRTWSTLAGEGVIAELRTGSADDVPMFLTDRIYITEDSPYVYTTLPGGNVWMDATGFAVSRGSEHPELAYELAKYLTEQLPVALRYGNFPARVDVLNNTATSNDEDIQNPANFIAPSMAIFDELVTYSLLSSQTIYGSYLHLPVVGATPQTARELLHEAQLQVIEDLETAEAYGATVQVTVNEPDLPPTPATGQVVLRFGMSINSSVVPNEPLLEQFAFEFAINHPMIQEIRIEPSLAEPNQLPTNYDCFYSNENIVFDLDLSNILSLDPLLNADPNFAPGEFVGNTLEQLRRDGRGWAYPMGIRPYILRYDPAVFNQHQIAPPQSDWRADIFDTILQSIWEQNGENSPVLEPLFGRGNTYILMLIAAHGGLPFDYRTDPPTVDLTSPETISAIGQVLDFAREGIIGYVPLNPDRSTSILLGAPPMFVDNLQSELPFNYSPYEIIGFPTGGRYNPVSYSIGTAYISAQSVDPERCYEWIRALAQRPDLLNNFPANPGTPDISISINQLGQNASEFFDVFASQLRATDTIIIPVRQDFYETRWVNQAFDRYVLEGADLVDVLAEAQMFIETYRECRANRPNLTDRECAEQVDNTL
jgi:ABC-type glycerol-3-phosphate transport system substrate-binding protein